MSSSHFVVSGVVFRTRLTALWRDIVVVHLVIHRSMLLESRFMNNLAGRRATA